VSEEEVVEIESGSGPGPDPGLRARVDAIVESALERNASDPVALDISELTSYASILIVTSGNSDRQVRSIAENVIKGLKARGDHPLGVEGMSEGRWVLIDANDIIVHVFDNNARATFNLESLWSDAPKLELHLETPNAAAGSDRME